MKKIILMFVLIVFLTGCNTKYKKDTINKKLSANYKTKKDYYVCVITGVNHDDYYNNNLNISYEDNAIKNEVIKEENNNYDMKVEEIKNTTYEDVIENNNEVLINDNEISDETKDTPLEDEEIKEKNNVDVKETNQNEEIKENSTSTDSYESQKEEVADLKKYYSPNGKYLGAEKVKVIDVSYYQGVIDWDKFAKESDCYGVILRIGYYQTMDKMFERNISEIKRLNIAYGIYLFSYATTLNGALKETNFTINMIDKYNLDPTLGIYYDIESWSTKNSNSNNISKQRYDEITQLYVNGVSNHISYKYKVKVYSGRWYAMNRLGPISKSYVDWVAEYNSTCKYDGSYSMWQYTSKGRVPGINTNVDISYLF